MAWVYILIVVLVAGVAEAQTFPPVCPGVSNDYTDATYGGKVRQLNKPGTAEHNIYHYRDPWNADRSYMVGFWGGLPAPGGSVETNAKMVLLDGGGCYIKDLYLLTEGHWQIVWDKHDPKIFYYHKSPRIYKFNVETLARTELINVSPRQINQWVSLNGPGDRLFTITISNPGKYETWELPGMTNHREFTIPDIPAGCDQRHAQYIGYENYIATECRNVQSFGGRIYRDDGTLVHQSVEGIDHSDFSPDGKWAYMRVNNLDYDFYLKNIDGSNDHLLFHLEGKAQNAHITWPKGVTDWFLVSFFARSSSQPPYQVPFDEVMKVHVDGSHEYLARTFSADAWPGYFWAQAQIAVAADGSRANFNNNCWYDTVPNQCVRSGVTNEVDQNILFLSDTGPPIPVPLNPPTGLGATLGAGE